MSEGSLHEVHRLPLGEPCRGASVSPIMLMEVGDSRALGSILKALPDRPDPFYGRRETRLLG